MVCERIEGSNFNQIVIQNRHFFFSDEINMSQVIGQSIQEFEMVSTECSGHESNTNEIQLKDDGPCHKLSKMQHEDIKHSKTKKNVFQHEHHQLQEDDIM